MKLNTRLFCDAICAAAFIIFQRIRLLQMSDSAVIELPFFEFRNQMWELVHKAV